MALTSPGLEVQVIDESTYLPSAQATVPLIVLATESNKLFNGAVTSGTLKTNAGKLDSVSSQRNLVTKYGYPTFQRSSIGSPLHGDERNEYGLMALYSAMGLGNRAYILRADIDLAEIQPLTSRPVGEPPNGTYWLNTAETKWGIFEWNYATNEFTNRVPLIATGNSIELDGGTFFPKSTVGSIGDYAVVIIGTDDEISKEDANTETDTETELRVFYKDYRNVWTIVGSTDWQASHGALIAVTANPSITESADIIINNSVTITLLGTVSDWAAQINAAAITGVSARVSGGRLIISVTSEAKSNGIVEDGKLVVEQVLGVGQTVGILDDLGLTPVANTVSYFAPDVNISGYASVPEWSSFNTKPRPSGSIWFKNTSVGGGLSLSLSMYNGDTSAWNSVSAPLYATAPAALAALDPTNGGLSIAAGTIWAATDVNSERRANIEIYRRTALGETSITGTAVGSFTASNNFTIGMSDGATYTSYTIVQPDATAAGFVDAIQIENIPDLEVTLSGNRITITHTGGGLLNLADINGTAIADAGFTASNSAAWPVPVGKGLVENYYTINSIALTNLGFTTVTTTPADLTTSTGTKSLRLSTGAKPFVAGQSVKISNGSNVFKGTVNSYVPDTGFGYGLLQVATTFTNSTGPGAVNWTVTNIADNYTVGVDFPTSPVMGDKFFDTDNGVEYVYNPSNAVPGVWVVSGSSNRFFSANTAGAPTGSYEGDRFYNTDLDKLFIYRDNQWNEFWSAGVRTSGITVSNFQPLTYTFDDNEPVTIPADGTLWYFSSSSDVDIMIKTSAGWRGYRNVTTDSRGYNLTNTDPNGVIVSASEPVLQSDESPLVAGDLWLDTSDLINYPKLYRYNGAAWNLIDKSDQVSSNGLLFADMRWGSTGTIDPASDDLPDTVGLLTSNYVDLDAPNPALYPNGMLVWNLRRSGYNIKRYVRNYFNATRFPNQTLPAEKDVWQTASGLQSDGSMYAGTQAQRNMVVSALKAVVDGSDAAREDQYEINMMACPGYPEVLPNLVLLNNDRANTAFIVGDTPLKLAPETVDIVAWSNNTTGTGLSASASEYLGVFYPAGLSSDLNGREIVVPPSHMMLRTIMRSDNLSFPWFAPAGARRGLVDNASDIGYIDATTSEFVRTGVRKSIRDSLYENKINPITRLPGTGILNYGQKTRYGLTSALDRINVARLVAYIRKALQPLANNFLFEPNDKVTRDQIKQSVEGLMNDLVAKRALYDYVVVCDDTNNTPDRVSRNELYVDIAIAPVRAIEFIYIPLRVRNPGASV